MWGSEPFWGLGYDWDPDWMLTERHAKGKRVLAEKLLAQAAEDKAKEPIGR
jgi:hypothetical protein